MIDPKKYGVSFSVKQCRAFGLDPRETLDWLLAQGFRRFRLMSYWDEHEKTPGNYDFTSLDWQLRVITAAGGEVSLCLGVKQPRWPEYHWPDWAWNLPPADRSAALLRYVEHTVAYYAPWLVISSWQLENEALLQGFGKRIDINRRRLRQEYELVRKIDPVRPISMSTSNGWGIPMRSPIPNYVGFSYYTRMFKKDSYRNSVQKPWLHRLRTSFIHILLGKPVFIHELQCEPWGSKAIWEMSSQEQDESMGPEQIERNLQLAHKVKQYPIDLWGAEWWYWRHQRGDDTIWDAVQENLA